MSWFSSVMAAVGVLSAAQLSLAQATLGPHGGQLIQVPQGSFEVVVDPQRKRVDLFALKELPTPPPNEIGIRLKTKKQKADLTVRTADPWRGLPHYEGILPHFPSLHPALSSSKGLEVELSF